MREALAGKVVISIAAGVRLPRLQNWLPASALIRATPNVALTVGEGMTALAPRQGHQRRRHGVRTRAFR
jgi:pyrroline-5-carboxylate reductase